MPSGTVKPPNSPDKSSTDSLTDGIPYQLAELSELCAVCALWHRLTVSK